MAVGNVWRVIESLACRFVIISTTVNHTLSNTLDMSSVIQGICLSGFLFLPIISIMYITSAIFLTSKALFKELITGGGGLIIIGVKKMCF